jgi:serine/threonine-protein kinase
MSISPGSRIGAYEVVSLLGAGGMGEVYRARDPRLQRDVALKILPLQFAADGERLARFQREAQVLASLTHANIGHIYGLEDGALVLELVEGPTLADRIGQGAIPVDEAVAIARQIADALEAAHEHGVIHRDLKPANIKVREDGTVKVLDFGLARMNAAPEMTSALGATLSPTISLAFTGVGVILGTAAYMAPEQARGKSVDKRADIWAFGCVLFEMLTARRAFDGTDATEMIAAVVRGEPDWPALPRETPARLRALLRRCLQKDPKQRLRDIGDARPELDASPDAPAVSAPSPSDRRRSWLRLAVFGAGAVALAALAVAAAIALRTEPARALARFVIPLPDGHNFTFAGRHLIAVAPNSSHIAYSANNQLYLRAADQLEAVPIRGTEGAGNAGGRSPFFSPDGRWVGFWADGALKKVSVSGGAPVVLCAAGNPWGATWSSDNTILFGQGTAGISRVSGDGGTPEVIITVKAGESAHGPQLLPDGRTVIFTLASPPVGAWNEAHIVAHSLDTGMRKILVEGGTDARYVETGHLVYALNGSLLAVPFDVDAVAVTGGPVPLIDEVGQSAGGGQTGAAHYSLSRNGTLVYISDTAGVTGSPPRSLVWVDRQGKEEQLKAPSRTYRYPRVSHDGTRVSLDIQDQNRDVWIWSLAGATLTRLTLDPAQEQYGVWTPDDRRIIFASARNGTPNLYWQAADGTGGVEQLTDSPNSHFPQAVTPDGKELVLRETIAGDANIMVMALNGERQVRPLVVTPFIEQNPELSHDGRWLAYESNESGRVEIYVRPFPNVGDGRWQVSTAGGTRPLWARDGRELFYVESTAGAVSLQRVPITLTPTFSAGTPVKMFDVDAATANTSIGRIYDVSSDGRRFLMIKSAAPATPDAPASRIVVNLVQNWFEELKRRVPTR